MNILDLSDNKWDRQTHRHLVFNCTIALIWHLVKYVLIEMRVLFMDCMDDRNDVVRPNCEDGILFIRCT